MAFNIRYYNVILSWFLILKSIYVSRVEVLSFLFHLCFLKRMSQFNNFG